MLHGTTKKQYLEERCTASEPTVRGIFARSRFSPFIYQIRARKVGATGVTDARDTNARRRQTFIAFYIRRIRYNLLTSKTNISEYADNDNLPRLAKVTHARGVFLVGMKGNYLVATLPNSSRDSRYYDPKILSRSVWFVVERRSCKEEKPIRRFLRARLSTLDIQPPSPPRIPREPTPASVNKRGRYKRR